MQPGRVALLFALKAALLLAGCASLDEGDSLQRGDVADAPAPARYEPGWAPLDTATIRPGVVLRTENGDCPTNFVFTRTDNLSVFLGTTAYCVRGLPVGAVALVGGSEQFAVLIYSSYATMDEKGETDATAREYNDFAVFHIDSSSRDQVNPALPQTGGPIGLADATAADVGDHLRAYARAPALPSQTDWREAVVTGRAGDWALLTHTVLPGSPGTLGGGVVDPEGRAIGVLVNLGVVPNPGANGVARLDALMGYAREHANLEMELATWAYTPLAATATSPLASMAPTES